MYVVAMFSGGYLVMRVEHYSYRSTAEERAAELNAHSGARSNVEYRVLTEARYEAMQAGRARASYYRHLARKGETA